MITNVRGVELIIDAWDGDVNIKSVLLLNCFNMMQRMILMITYMKNVLVLFYFKMIETLCQIEDDDEGANEDDDHDDDDDINDVKVKSVLVLYYLKMFVFHHHISTIHAISLGELMF